MSLDVRQIDARAADLLDPRVRGRDDRIGLAALARAESGGAGGGRRVEERHALAPRAAAGARRPAVDAGRSDGIDEESVRRTVVSDDCVPARGVVELFQDE